jgi:hypothetical protein
VPLSEDEQRLLEQMEQALADEDPKFVSALRGTSLRSHNRRRAVLGTVGFVAGVALLMAGVIVPLTIVSVVGFVVMLGSAYVALTYWRRVSGPEEISASRAGFPALFARARQRAARRSQLQRLHGPARGTLASPPRVGLLAAVHQLRLAAPPSGRGAAPAAAHLSAHRRPGRAEIGHQGGRQQYGAPARCAAHPSAKCLRHGVHRDACVRDVPGGPGVAGPLDETHQRV